MRIDRSSSNSDSLTIIQPSSGWQIINFKELKDYRDLFYFLVWRDVKTLYAQTVMGFSWAIIQPLVQIVLFTIIFGKIARLSTDGIPYILFSTVAIIPWTYMSQAMALSSQSLIQGSNMLGKIYFPRLLFPITPVLSKLVDFGISLLIVLCLLLYYRVSPTWNLLLFPLFFIMMMSVPTALGLWLSSLAIRFRDVKLVMPFFIQMLMYSAPIVYSASSIPSGSGTKTNAGVWPKRTRSGRNCSKKKATTKRGRQFDGRGVRAGRGRRADGHAHGLGRGVPGA